jgi:simple sugar transport system ATP-binding protein
MGFCSENRKEEGVVEELSLRENIILALQGKMGIFRTIPKRKQQAMAEKFIEVLNIQAHSTEQEVRKRKDGGASGVRIFTLLLDARLEKKYNNSDNTEFG